MIAWMKSFYGNNKISLALFSLLLIIDIGSKAFVDHYLPLMGSVLDYPYGGVPVFKEFLGVEFSITHAVNKGAAFGFFSSYQMPLIVFRLIVIACLAFYIVDSQKTSKSSFPYMLILAGALGNVFDVLIYGHVVDMFHFAFFGYSYPVFNVADSSIFIGVCLLFFRPKEKNDLQRI